MLRSAVIRYPKSIRLENQRGHIEKRPSTSQNISIICVSRERVKNGDIFQPNNFGVSISFRGGFKNIPIYLVRGKQHLMPTTNQFCSNIRKACFPRFEPRRLTSPTSVDKTKSTASTPISVSNGIHKAPDPAREFTWRRQDSLWNLVAPSSSSERRHAASQRASHRRSLLLSVCADTGSHRQPSAAIGPGRCS